MKKLAETTPDEIKYVAKFYGWTEEKAKKVLEDTPLVTYEATSIGCFGSHKVTMLGRDAALKRLETLKASAPSEEQIALAVKNKHQPIVIKSKDEQ